MNESVCEEPWRAIRARLSAVPTNRFRQEAMIALAVAMHDIRAEPTWGALYAALAVRAHRLTAVRHAFLDEANDERKRRADVIQDYRCAKAFWTEERLAMLEACRERSPRDVADMIRRAFAYTEEAYVYHMMTDAWSRLDLFGYLAVSSRALSLSDSAIAQAFPHRYGSRIDPPKEEYYRFCLRERGPLHPMDQALVEEVIATRQPPFDRVDLLMGSCGRAIREMLKHSPPIAADTNALKNDKTIIEEVGRGRMLVAVHATPNKSCLDTVQQFLDEWRELAYTQMA